MTYPNVTVSVDSRYSVYLMLSHYIDRKVGHFENRCAYFKLQMLIETRMWANAQRDGRPAEHRWRPLFNAAKFG